MARLVVLGAGVAGHTAALHAKRKLGKEHEVIVVSPNSNWNWIPSNIWVGTGYMQPEQVIFPLRPIYDKMGIHFYQAKAVSIHPEGDRETADPYVTIEYTSEDKKGQVEKIKYDFLINATGPKLDFDATKGLGPDKNSLSVCTYSHAAHTKSVLEDTIERMKKGEKKTFLVGVGHGNATCQGAAFEYIFNLDHVLREKKVRDKARIIWISNEHELGDFGIGGMTVKRNGHLIPSKLFMESLFRERDIEWILGSHVKEVVPGETIYENAEGEERSVKHDFAMLIPRFAGVGLKAYDRNGNDITSELFMPNGLMKVDADYSNKPYEEWSAEDWPKTYQSPKYKNIFAVGIAFAPPHAISKPFYNKNGTPIFPTPPRTGMPSGVMAREVALNIVDMIEGKAKEPVRTASLANMGAACIASTGAGIIKGSAVTMTIYPIVPDYKRFPGIGRDLSYTYAEVGLAAHWLKHVLHYVFTYKAKANPLWALLPE